MMDPQVGGSRGEGLGALGGLGSSLYHSPQVRPRCRWLGLWNWLRTGVGSLLGEVAGSSQRRGNVSVARSAGYPASVLQCLGTAEPHPTSVADLTLSCSPLCNALAHWRHHNQNWARWAGTFEG